MNVMSNAKRLTALLLCAVLLLGLMPAFAVGTRAAETTTDPVEESTGVTTPEEETTEPAEDSGVSALAEDDGTVTIPEVLRPYMGGKEKLEKVK